MFLSIYAWIEWSGIGGWERWVGEGGGWKAFFFFFFWWKVQLKFPHGIFSIPTVNTLLAKPYAKLSHVQRTFFSLTYACVSNGCGRRTTSIGKDSFSENDFHVAIDL